MRTPIGIILGTVLAIGTCLPAHAAVPATAYQDRLNGSLQELLDSVVGPGHAVVTTAVDVDLDHVETVTRRYSWDPSVVALSEKLSRTSYTGVDGSRYESTGAARTNALNQVNEIRINAPGDVKRLSVAVVVDRPVDVAQLQKLVSVAAGADPARGDTVVVSTGASHTEAAAAGGQTSSAMPATTWGPVLTGVLALLALVLVLVRRRRASGFRVPVERVQAYRVEVLQTTPAIGAPARPGGLTVTDPRRTAALLRDWTGSA